MSERAPCDVCGQRPRCKNDRMCAGCRKSSLKRAEAERYDRAKQARAFLAQLTPGRRASHSGFFR